MREKNNIPLEIQDHFKISNNGYKLLDIKIVNGQFRIFLKCDNELHDPYWVNWQHYKNRGDRCSKCRYINNSKKRLIYNEEKIKEIINEHGYNLIKIHSIGDEGKITISSKEGYIIDTRVNNIARGCTPEFFYAKNQYTINNIDLWCKINNKSYVLISNIYIDARKDLNWKCLKCEKIFKRSWNITRMGLFECPYCSGRKASEINNLLIINPELSKQWNYEKNYPICPENILPNTTKSFWWICDNCGHVWKKSVHYRNQRNAPCPNCKMSKGEHAIKSFLENNNILYHNEYSFENCKNIKNLRFDFYLPKYNLCIEYQGEFHYKIINGINNKNSLNKQITYDSIKRDFCKKNNIKLLEIPYWKYKNMKNILMKNLNN